MTDLRESWFLRHFPLSLALVLSVVVFGTLTAVAYGIGPAPSEHDAIVLYGLCAFLVGFPLIAGEVVIRWVERPL